MRGVSCALSGRRPVSSRRFVTKRGCSTRRARPTRRARRRRHGAPCSRSSGPCHRCRIHRIGGAVLLVRRLELPPASPRCQRRGMCQERRQKSATVTMSPRRRRFNPSRDDQRLPRSAARSVLARFNPSRDDQRLPPLRGWRRLLTPVSIPLGMISDTSRAHMTLARISFNPSRDDQRRRVERLDQHEVRFQSL